MTEPERIRRGSHVSARLRIVGWLMVSLVIALVALVVTVRSAMLAEIARDVNGDVEQEIGEFRSFAQEGSNPETAGPFTDMQTLFEVSLRRQRTGANEMLIGYLPESEQALIVDGPEVPSLEEAGIPPGSPAFEDLLRGPAAGVIETEQGSMRYGRDTVRLGDQQGTFLVLAYEQPGRAGVNDTTRLMVMVGAGSLLLAAIIAYLAAGQILRPVRSVRRAAAEITERDLTRRIPITGNDDIAELAVTFNDMLNRLESAFAAEQRFVNDAAHELRTPITVIRGHLETMSDDPHERASSTALVLDELGRMSRIVTDLLALAQAERPDFVRASDQVDLAELTVEIDTKVQALGDRRWSLATIADGSARVDGQRVTQAVLQLAQNAVEHTTRGDLIEIASSFAVDDELGTTVCFSVRDEGPGVAERDAEVIFERFGRGQVPGARQRAGAGLGLAIVRAIAEGHGGCVVLESERGQGATFTLVLPVDGVAAHGEEEPALEPADARTEIDDLLQRQEQR